MSLIDFFLSRKKNTADIAKKRLQEIFQENKKNLLICKDFIDLKKELFYIIDKYIQRIPNIFTVKIKQNTSNILIIKVYKKFLHKIK